MPRGKYVRTPEHRKKLSDAHTGIKHSEETKKKIGLGGKGRIPANKGKKASDQTRERVRLAKLGKKPSESTREKMRIAHLGKKISEETREKMRLAKLGTKQSPEHVRNRMISGAVTRLKKKHG